MKAAAPPEHSAARKKILEAASDLFYKNGIRATGIDAVIEAADVARMTLYKYFPSKDALIHAVLSERADRAGASLVEAIEHAGPTTPDKILAVFDWQSLALQGEGFRGCAFFNAVVENPDLESENFALALNSKLLVREQIAALVGQLSVDTPELLTEQLCLLFEGASVRSQMGFFNVAGPAARKAAEQLISDALLRPAPPY